MSKPSRRGRKKLPGPAEEQQSLKPEHESEAMSKTEKWLKLANGFLRPRKRKRSA